MARRSPLAALLKLGPTTERWRNAVGVHTAQDLQPLGSINADCLLKGHGDNASLQLVYAIEGALHGLDGKRLPVRLKIELKERAADALSKDRKPRGFSLVGSTIIDAHMQAIGMVSHHLIECFRYKALRGHK